MISAILGIFISYFTSVLEILFGTNNYASILFTNLVAYFPVKYILFRMKCCASGPFFVFGSLLTCYWSIC